MNIERILRITNFYFLLTGYQIRWFNRKSLRYIITIWGVIYIIILYLVYLICFCHHFEKSAILKLILDMSLFLKSLVRLYVLFGLKALIFCVIEWKNLNKITNGLVSLLKDAIKRQEPFDQQETLTYLIFFSTLLVSFGFGLYIAVELNFQLPSVDQIMISFALFLPHFILAGCLRIYTLGLWLLKEELQLIKYALIVQDECVFYLSNATVVEISPNNTNNEGGFFSLSKRVSLIGEYVQNFDCVLQRQLAVLMGLNFNCLLAGIYSRLYFETSWKVLFTNRNCRIFYAANTAIFICIALDYGILLFARWSFYNVKENLLIIIHNQLYGKKVLLGEKERKILKSLKCQLRKNFQLKLFNIVEFDTWNFLMLHVSMITIIILIVGYQYFNDQIVTLNERLDFIDAD